MDGSHGWSVEIANRMSQIGPKGAKIRSRIPDLGPVIQARHPEITLRKSDPGSG
jgi:hypothetical protein